MLLELTGREMDVLAELCKDGADGDTIARRLKITRHTVKSHVWRMQQKAGLSTRLELVVAVLHGHIWLACKVPPKWFLK